MGAPSSDVDIFLTCAPYEAYDRLKKIYRSVQKVLRESYGSHSKLLVTRSANAITFNYCVGGTIVGQPVQVVLRLGNNAAAILTHFDVDCCAVGFVPGTTTVLSTKRAMRAMKHAANVVDSSLSGQSYVRRLLKYADRGFCIAVPGFEPDRVSPDLFNASYVCFAHSGLRAGPCATSSRWAICLSPCALAL